MTVHLDHTLVITRDQLSDGTECFVASDPAFPGCVSYGRTEAEAVEDFDEAKRVWLRARGDRSS